MPNSTTRKRGVTTTVATVVIVLALVVGLAAGYFIYPVVVPPSTPEDVQEQLDQLQADLADALDDIQDLEDQLAAVPTLEGTIQIGALLSLSGDLRTFGENEFEGMKLAAEEVNEFLADAGYDFEVEIVPEDTQTEPDIALEKLQGFQAQGIKVVLGPLSSGEAAAIREYANANDMLLVSQSSTDPGLSIVGDNLFRFVSDDTIQGGLAMPGIFEALDVTHLFPVWRRDAWGDSLVAQAKQGAEDAGLTVADGVGFDPDTVRAAGFTAELDQLVAGVEALVEQAGDPDNVGVLFIAFELAPDLLEKAMDFPILTQVKWVGSDGTAGSGAVLENEVAAEFAEMVNWLNPIFGIDRSNERWQRVNDELREILGRNPESYTFNMYDQVWVVTLSLLAAGEYDTAKIKAVFPTVADNYLGASGWTRLNDAGDRVSSDYDLWAVREVSPGTYDWEIVGVWVFATGQITWFE